MAQTEAARQFKRHYKKAMRLKEGGAAWQREIDLAHHYLEIGKAEYEERIKRRYSY